MGVVTLEDLSIGATTANRGSRWRDDRVMADYIYNRCSGGTEKNIFWEERKTSVLIYFVDSKSK